MSKRPLSKASSSTLANNVEEITPLPSNNKRHPILPTCSPETKKSKPSAVDKVDGPSHDCHYNFDSIDTKNPIDYSLHACSSNELLKLPDTDITTNDEEYQSLPIRTGSGLANIPQEATSALTSSFEQSECDGNIEENLIPRAEILEKIIGIFCQNHLGLSDTNIPSLLPSNVRLTLRGMGGLGKTTLAAMAVSLTDLRQVFDHILWLNLGNCFLRGSNRNNLTLEMYLDCLRKLCNQLGISGEKFNRQIILHPGDSPAKTASKTIIAMEEFKSEMSDLLKGLKILIVLDDVWGHEDVELFNFGEDTTFPFGILLTTRTVDADPYAGSHSIIVSLLTQEEAKTLFLCEAGLDDSIDFNCAEAIDFIVGKCGYLPLGIRMAGRLAKVCGQVQPDIGWNIMIPNLMKETHHPSVSPMILILDRSFSFLTSRIAGFAMKLCFSVFAIVFHRDDQLRPWVPFDALELIWEALMLAEDMKCFRNSFHTYRLKRFSDIADLMCTMGLFDVSIRCEYKKTKKQKHFRIHHDLMWEYGKFFASKVSSFDETFVKKIENGLQLYDIECSSDSDSTLHYNTVKWNAMIVQQFMSKLETNSFMNSQLYSLCWLPIHLIKAGMLDKSFNMLKNEEMLKLRMRLSGVESGSRTIISYVKLFEKASCNGTTSVETLGHKLLMISVISFLHGYLCNLNDSFQLQNETKGEIGRAFILFGVELQKKSEWSESLDYFTLALHLFQSIGYGNDHPDITRASEHADACASLQVILVLRDSSSKICIKYGKELCSEETGTNGTSFELISHPGYAIVRLKDQAALSGNMKWEACFLSVASKNSALHGVYDGQFLQIVPGDFTFFVSGCALVEGIPVSIRSPISFNLNTETPCTGDEKEKRKLLDAASSFSIELDGTVYPTRAPHLCLGLTPYPKLSFVNRHSPNKAIFKNFLQLMSSKISYSENKISEKSTKNQDIDDGIKLELLSHPGMAIVPMFDTGLKKMPLHSDNQGVALIGLGPVKRALSAKFSAENHVVIIGGKCDGASFFTLGAPANGKTIMLVAANDNIFENMV
eukprot:CAMPEP_0194273026 /NCGR_PEP_ID=MMETSP0169-20130528/6448_1 /TAXON_ID=218684 /ORGANISM="Corethron pennatum, Strain L29A3" /LENGTH=1050 /DNA_ID=CAMNT_0039015843 /DNA_START=311 /DNA_END=3459 /DNA_ORIENTATION=-